LQAPLLWELCLQFRERLKIVIDKGADRYGGA